MTIKYLRSPGPDVGPTGPIGPIGATGPTGPAGLNGTDGLNGKDATAMFLSAFFEGPLYVFTGQTRQYVWKTTTVKTVVMHAKVASIGGNIQLGVRVNGILRQTFTLPQNQTYLRFIQSPFSVNEDDYLTLDIISIGSIYPGSDLSVQLVT